MKKIAPKIVKRRVWDEPMAESPKAKMKTEKVYPKISIPTSALPEAKNWKIGEKYTVVIEVEMTGLSIRERSKGEEMHFESDYDNRADFELKGIEVKKGSKAPKVDRRYVEKADDEES